jgi:hypothetical protein
MLAALLYVVPVLTIAVTLYIGYLGWQFYLREVVRGGESPAETRTETGPTAPERDAT